MPTQPFVLDPTRLHLLAVVAEPASIVLRMRTCSASALCPVCGRPSARVHSWYRRTLADLPWAGIPAHILLWSRRINALTPPWNRDSACPTHRALARLAAPSGLYRRR